MKRHALIISLSENWCLDKVSLQKKIRFDGMINTVRTGWTGFHKRIRVLCWMCGAAVSMPANMLHSKQAAQGKATKHLAVEKCDLYGHAGSSYGG